MTAFLTRQIFASALVMRLTLALSLLAVPGAALAGFDWTIEHTGSVNDIVELEAFHTTVTNTGAARDSVMVNMVKNVPANWVASLCEDELCYPPFVLEIALDLNPGESVELIIDITPLEVEGKGWTDITLHSNNNPSDTAAARFSVVTSGLDVLMVSSVSGADEARYESAIAAAGQTVAIWDQATMGKTTSVELAAFDTVVWATGAGLTGLDATDMTNLTAHIAGGGDLFLSGQNLAYNFCDAGSPGFDATAHAWFQNTLGADYTANVGSTVSVTASAGDAIFGGASYDLNGGDGSNNNTSPDVLSPSGSGMAGLDYASGGNALISKIQGSGKTAFAGFGFEGLASAAQRDDFMNKILTWLGSSVTAVADDLQSVFVQRPLAWPNPFNPQTSIRFEVGGERAVPAKVTVFDLQGRAVRQLFEGSMSPGPRRLNWDGRDDAGRHLATGTYLAQVKVDQDQRTVKMTLVK